jgi:hypothetical protein
VIDDGRPLLSLTAVTLLISGVFAIFLSFRREFLPHDVAYLNMTAEQLCRIASCRVVQFMFHDRVAFGGTLIAIAVLYLWLATFPLRDGARWAWWAFALSGALGFASFLAYLGYGYLDSWHGAGTLRCCRSSPSACGSRGRSPLRRRLPWLRSDDAKTRPLLTRVGRWGLVATGLGMVTAGLSILVIGTTRVFVPQDLAFIGLTRGDLVTLNAHLVPLIAHDRAGFGGGLASAGVLVAVCAWYARPARAFHEATLIAGVAGFGCAIGVHYFEGYTDVTHLGPALAGATLFALSVFLEMWPWQLRPVPAHVRTG